MQAAAGSRAALLAQAGQALYGRRWILPLGQALNVPDGTFRPWAAGKGRIPTSIWREILGIVQARQRELRLAAKMLKAQIAEDQAAQLGIVARQIRNVLREEPPETIQ
jgi:hypothetical protein